jgi:hypothetical protein
LGTTLLVGCASAGRPLPAGPVAWPAGRYVASAQLEYTTGAVRPGSSPRRLVQAEVYIAPDGTMALTSGDGSCREQATERPDERAFRCGETSFLFVVEGRTLRGSASAPVTYWVSGWTRCTRWGTDENGRRVCDRMEDHPDELRSARATAKLAVVSAG